MRLFTVRTKVEDQRKIATGSMVSRTIKEARIQRFSILVNGEAGDVNELSNALLW